MTDQDVYHWSGMAAIVSSESIGNAMKKTTKLHATGVIVSYIPGQAMGGVSAEMGKQLFAFMAEGNLAVYRDIYWQHLAFESLGIEELKRLHEKGELQTEAFQAWMKISKGEIAAGNRDLLHYEQLRTLQPLYDKYAATTPLISRFATSPIPDDNVSFHAFVPGGDIGTFDDRWKWISGSMLPNWEESLFQSKHLVDQMMDRIVND